MRSLFYALSLIAFLSAFAAGNAVQAAPGGAAAVAADQSPSKEAFIKAVIQKVMGILKDEKTPFATKQAQLKQEFTAVVDTDWIARFVLGRAWNTATPEQKAQYIDLYRTYLTDMYIAKLDQESEGEVQGIRLLGIRGANDDTYNAKTEILLSGSSNVQVSYLLRNKDNQPKIIDINIEGISLLNTHREQFSQMASSEGMEAVIKKLGQLIDSFSAT